MLLLFSLPLLWSQESEAPHFDMTGFPLWAKDLRRAEIVAFGSFPFAYFFANFTFGMYRYSSHDWDRRYAPWPITAAGGIGPTRNEKYMILGLAAGSAVLISVMDYAIVRSRRNRIAREAEAYPAGVPIIITRPLTETEPAEPDEPEDTEITGNEIPEDEASGDES